MYIHVFMPISIEIIKDCVAEPSVPFIDGSVFSTEALNHHWGVSWLKIYITVDICLTFLFMCA